MSRIRGWRVFVLLGATTALVGVPAVHPAAAQPAAASGFQSFDAFVKEVKQVTYADMSVAGRSGAVTSAASFDQMRSYVLDMYRGVKVEHSFRTDEGYFDCVTVDSQPSVRALGGTDIATPPPPTASGPAVQGGAHNAASPLTLGLKDAYGNAISCADGTIPMQRLSLDRLTRFSSLRAFLSKHPGDAQGVSPQQEKSHKHAIGYQNVTNHGGDSWLNVWDPDTGATGFSLSQQWYVAGSDSDNSLQTAEGGWVKYAPKFGAHSVLFIYFTPDNYGKKDTTKSTLGCYNLDCQGFVQTNKNWALGGAFANYSTYGGQQYGFQEQWKLVQDKWWLFLQAGGSFDAVGYYPVSVYNGGAMATAATSAEYGGETTTYTDTYPPMGSGHFASEGFGKAAYQRSIFYIDTSDASVWTSLTTYESAPSCYTVDYTPASQGGSWGSYIYFGGPGGNTC
jgi:hypothetical protein